MRNVLFGVLSSLALATIPMAGHAQMPGDPCEKERVGTTIMSTDRQHIIGCLETGDTSPDGVFSEWKAFTKKDKAYSLTCLDWKALGYSSKDECIKDGRWHLVYKHDGTGHPTFGSLSDLATYAQNGADVKNSDSGGMHTCDVISWADGMATCMGSFRMAGEVTRNFGGVNTVGSNGTDPGYYLGAAARRSDGSRVNANIMALPAGNVSNGNTAIKAYLRPPADAAALNWYVRF